VSLGKFKKTLHREFTRNPAKSFTLLALIPVAGYFIIPPLWNLLPTAKGGKPSTPSTPSFVAVAGSEQVAAVNGPLPMPRWQDVAVWMLQDARMKPATAVRTRDPFRPAAKPDLAQEDQEHLAGTERTATVASIRPEDCGLALTATIVGTTKRLATINGRLYAENASVQFDFPGASAASPPDNAFVLKTVTKNHVVLERHGELFKLRLAGMNHN
jgi:hypothetical protein